MSPDMFKEEAHHSCRVNHGDCRHGMHAFRQPVHYYKDGIVPFGLWQLSDSVNRDDLPMAAWDLVGHKLPHLLCQEGFAAVAGITPCDVVGRIMVLYVNHLQRLN